MPPRHRLAITKDPAPSPRPRACRHALKDDDAPAKSWRRHSTSGNRPPTYAASWTVVRVRTVTARLCLRHVAACACSLTVALCAGLPRELEGADANRCTLAYFCVSGLDLLGQLTEGEKARTAQWVRRLAIPSAALDAAPGGFRGSTFFVADARTGGVPTAWDLGHLAMTYSALAILRICMQPSTPDGGAVREVVEVVEAVDIVGVRRLVASLQDDDGSFRAHAGGEKDLRFLFCACAVSRMCSLLEAQRRGGAAGTGGVEYPMDVDKAVEYVLSCQTYEGGFGLGPGAEAHGVHVRMRERVHACVLALLRALAQARASLCPRANVRFVSQSTRASDRACARASTGAFDPGWFLTGGSTYCAVAALALLGRLSALGGRDAREGHLSPPRAGDSSRRARLARWLLLRQAGLNDEGCQSLGWRGGYRGRAGKEPDSCYSFWIGASLHILGLILLAAHTRTCFASRGPHGLHCESRPQNRFALTDRRHAQGRRISWSTQPFAHSCASARVQTVAASASMSTALLTRYTPT